MKNRWLVLCLLGVSVLYVGYVVWSLARPPRTVPPALAPGFAGSRTCAECHPDVYREHAESHHAHALHDLAEFERRQPLPDPRWIPDPDLPASYRITKREAVLGIEAQTGPASHWQPVRWAFGSGNQGMTPVGALPDGRFVESALSFYRRSGWDFTPGFLAHRPAERQAMPTGDAFSARDAFDCFDCHATGVRRSEQGLILEGARYGVQCERCHGAGETHVRQARAGQPRGNVSIPGPSARRLVSFCATCHRSQPPAGVALNAPAVVRFAPVGFQRSRCYLASNDTFSCVSCHNPHRDASRDPGFYRAVCTSCHGGRPQWASCPEKPQGNCISCHMPKQIVQRNTIFTDHWIRVVRRSKRTARGLPPQIPREAAARIP